MFTVRHYLTADERDVFNEWLKTVRDPLVKLQVARRVNRVEQGNFGDHRSCRDGVWELRIHQGAGYRVYYALTGTTVVLLLCGGDTPPRTPASSVPWSIGRIGNGGPENEGS